MLVPLTRKTFEALLPRVATGPQYTYCWGKISDFLRRLLISVVAVTVLILGIGIFLGPDVGFFRFLLGIIAGLYWLWGPVLWAGLRNLECRKYAYTGFWQGEVLDAYVSEELIGTEETVNERGDLVIVENRERYFTIEVGDETGFSTQLSVPLKRSHQGIAAGDIAEMLVFSNRGDLSRIVSTSDIYIPQHNIWVSDYPYLQREEFIEVSRRLNSRDRAERKRSKRSRRDTSSMDYDYPNDSRKRGSKPGKGEKRGGEIVPQRSRRRSSRKKPLADW